MIPRTAFLGGPLGYWLLRRLAPPGRPLHGCDGSAYTHRSKLEALLGPDIFHDLRDKTILDFGCGNGSEAIELARRGQARKVIGLDTRESALARARLAAAKAGVSDRCAFVTTTDEPVDMIVSLDGFEHFDDPAQALLAMRALLKSDGNVRVAFGPTWFHPYGGHLFSVFPWAHLLFTETALIRWRADFKSDGATRFREVEGGLNQLTIRRFKKLIRQSPFEVTALETVPIRRLGWLQNPLTLEFTTAIVRCRLIPRDNTRFLAMETGTPMTGSTATRPVATPKEISR